MLYAARNLAYKECQGEFIAFLDVDDWWSPEKLERQIPLFNNPQVGLVYSNYWMVNELKNIQDVAHKKTLYTGWVLDELLNDYSLGMLTIILRKMSLDTLDYIFDNDYHIIGDYDLSIRLADHCKYDCIQEPIAYCRWHGNNEQIHQKKRHIKELQNWLEKMKFYKNISHNPELKYVKIKIIKLKIRHLLEICSRFGAFKELLN